MIRFRQKEDEQRYLRLRTEIYRHVARGLPSGVVFEVMRNFQRLEQLLQLEGVRQGLAVAELSLLAEGAGRPGVRHFKAFQAHAMMYGSQDTPLTDVEKEWAEKLGHSDALGTWLDSAPMRYAPETLAEWEREQAGEPVKTAALQKLVDNSPLSDSVPIDMHPDGLLDDEDSSFDPDVDLSGSSLQSFFEGGGDEEPDAQERPDMLDRVRDHLQMMRSKGWNPDSWEKLIMELHVSLQTDAAFLDIQLSTNMGQTVLAQAGIHLSPGAGLYLAEIQSAAAAHQEQAESDDGGAAKDGGTHPNG